MSIQKLAANAEMVFLDLPFYERVSRLKELGFRVGLWGLGDHDVERLANESAAPAARGGQQRAGHASGACH